MHFKHSFRPLIGTSLALALAACGQQPISSTSQAPQSTSPTPTSTAKPAASGDIERTLALPPTDGFGMKLRVDGQGNLYTLLTRILEEGEGNDGRYESILRKHTPQGSLEWEKTFAQISPIDFAVNRQGAVAFIGNRLEDTPCDNPLKHLYLCDYTGITHKFDTHGNVVFSVERPSGRTFDNPSFTAVAIGEAGGVYTYGHGLAQQFDDAGKAVWKTVLQGSNFHPKLTVDSQNNVYFVRSNDTETNRQMVFLTKLDAGGQIQFSRDWGLGVFSVPEALGLSSDGNVYTLWRSLQEGTTYRAFLKNYAQNGTWNFNQEVGKTTVGGFPPIQGMVVSGQSAYLYGSQVDYDSGSPTRDTPYLAKHDASGARVWTKDLRSMLRGGTIDDVTSGPDGKLYVVYGSGEEYHVAIMTP
ncbi:hypothetical protein [Deinococcus peraridilitoris]|uniref:Uncharacterized protein n=1 Tax=Deinococcus peraridilitoris (strain DSM 19664 / LMG 22246 / CIP 109416 / KR-200) TaxID=937777 RepID=K9ZZC6_DEIPD|nr:hypothetical protein [Deinococcus peraridilitoris]AFZ66951.1 hypothetical protein Deipe_1409 [Deinococcus peraridilitoris DSM 19664]